MCASRPVSEDQGPIGAVSEESLTGILLEAARIWMR